MSTPLIISIIALLLSGLSVWYSRKSSIAAERSSRAAESASLATVKKANENEENLVITIFKEPCMVSKENYSFQHSFDCLNKSAQPLLITKMILEVEQDKGWFQVPDSELSYSLNHRKHRYSLYDKEIPAFDSAVILCICPRKYINVNLGHNDFRIKVWGNRSKQPFVSPLSSIYYSKYMPE